MINDYKDEGLKIIVLSSFKKCLKTICDKSVFTTQIIWVNENFFFRLWNSSVLWRAYLLWEEVYMSCSVMQFVRETWIWGPFLDSSGNFRALKAVLSSPCLHSGWTFNSIQNDIITPSMNESNLTGFWFLFSLKFAYFWFILNFILPSIF